MRWVRWRWRRWRADHYVWLALGAYRVDPSARNRAALARATEYAYRVEVYGP